MRLLLATVALLLAGAAAAAAATNVELLHGFTSTLARADLTPS
jgi:hypothetical protein